ncbi:hypothetical protein TRAPUB_10988 [Trametes pubescens]|uniref:Uncharacterized protein n=1 Tax=Trametes pubescens TaxID=154538 RepID=A0A1M2VXU6_TRAPU|nr:hypothetical protein TRAPUB_12121 [Trametes pubescens]OJT12408.1 hypothetical protein TRAPUB_10997 [Trametes pubescens]OJT12458.1 hypothetical protein TRAPUB_10994 [Trametes pubescens]OJT12462.1 hypothetical protein TRAPUB_10988 [Trametes pubescens]
MSQNPPSTLPPITPGPIRVHRPRESPRYMPYELPATVIREAHEHERNENRPPALSALNIPVGVPMAPGSYLASTPLRRHASTSALMDTNVTNWSPFTTPPASDSAFTVDPIVYAQQVIRKLDLGRFQADVYEFSQASTADREVLLFGQVLKLRDDTQMNTLAIKENKETIADLKNYMSNNWTLSKAQEDLLNGLLGHWLVKPLRTYEKIYLRVGRYVHLRAEWLHLGVYVTDPLARQTVDKHLQVHIGHMKGAFRKEIVKAMDENKPLSVLSRAMLQKYHAPVIPNDPPRDTMAVIAFLRLVASQFEAGPTAPNTLGDSSQAGGAVTASTPSSIEVAARDIAGSASRGGHADRASKRARKGNDNSEKTDGKYWNWVEAALDKLYEEHGEDRTSIAWKQWEDQIIKEDMAMYTGSTGRRGGRVSKATSASPRNGPSASSSMPGAGSLVPDVGRPMTFAEDMEREVGNESEQGHVEGPTFNLYQASVLPVNIPADSMNGDVDISSLGNIAGTLDSAL